MSELFRTYEQEFITSVSSINKKIQTINILTNQKKQLAINDIKQDLRQCQKIVKLMQTECNSFDVQIKFQWTKKVRQYKKDLDDNKKKLSKAEQEYAFEKNKQMLIGAQLDQQKSTTNREKLIKHGEMMSDTNYKLKQSVKIMHETEQIGHGVQIQLTNQTGKMKQNKQRLIEMRDDIGSSQKKIQSIMMRIKKNKLVLVGSIGVVLIIVIVAIVVHFTKK